MEATGGARRGGSENVPGPPLPMLTVAAVARRLGVAPPTLRTWDRRYGLGPSAHTAGAHRRYSPSDVARLMVMRRLTLQGVPPADAARIALATPAAADGGPMASVTAIGDLPAEEPYDTRGRADTGPDGLAPLDLDPESEDVSDPFSESDLSAARFADRTDRGGVDAFDGPWRDEPGTEIETPWLGVLRNLPGGETGPAAAARPSGGGRVVALPDGNPATRGLARAAMSLDTYEVARLFREGVRRQGGVAPCWDGMVVPVLRALGERTQATGDGIDVEHAFSEALMSVLRGIAFSVREPRNPAPVLLVCAESDQHSLPLHVLAAALAERDVVCRMLGTGLPPHALAAAARRTGPCAVVLHAQSPGADASSTDELRRQRPAPRIVLGGPGWKPGTVPSGARTAASLGEALDEVMLAVHA